MDEQRRHCSKPRDGLLMLAMAGHSGLSRVMEQQKQLFTFVPLHEWNQSDGLIDLSKDSVISCQGQANCVSKLRVV